MCMPIKYLQAGSMAQALDWASGVAFLQGTDKISYLHGRGWGGLPN